MAQQPNWENIRTLLIEGFGDEELRQLIFDTPVFKPVFNQLTANTGKTQIVQHLLEYADQKELAQILLDEAKEHNLAKYEIYQPYYLEVAALRQMENTLSRPGSPQSRSRPAQPNRWLLLGLTGLIGVITLVGLGSILIYFNVGKGTPTPAKMPGDVKIAVASFVQADPTGDQDQGRELARRVAEKLQAKTRQAGVDPKIVVWGPDDGVGHITGQNEAEWQRSAQKIAAQVGAQVVVYGVIDAAQMVTPKFSLSPETFSAFAEVEEITGQAAMGAPQPLGSDIEQYTASRQLTTNVEILWNVISGLFAYYLGDKPDYSKALNHFQQAEKYWPGSEGKHVLYVLLGNTAIQLEDYKQAESYFNDALSKRDYPQAYLGLGEVYRLRLWSYSDGTRPVDQNFWDWLSQALDNYNKARAYATESPPDGLAAKVNFGLGECYFYRGNQENPQANYSQAKVYFQDVILACEANCPNLRLREAVANAHARLGALYLLVDPKNPDCALKEYQRAVTMRSQLQSNFEPIINQLKNNKNYQADQARCLVGRQE